MTQYINEYLIKVRGLKKQLPTKEEWVAAFELYYSELNPSIKDLEVRRITAAFNNKEPMILYIDAITQEPQIAVCMTTEKELQTFSKGDIVKHVKSDGDYEVLEWDALLTSDKTKMVVYRSTDYSKPEVWIRPVTEFGDGRFKLIQKYGSDRRYGTE